VAVYDFGQVAGMPFFLMEYVDGLNLRELERGGKLNPLAATSALANSGRMCRTSPPRGRASHHSFRKETPAGRYPQVLASIRQSRRIESLFEMLN
jgi:hypothetical protein